MGSQKTPDVVHPGEAAQAAMGTAAAGEKMSLANQPVDQYGNLITTEMLGPAQMQTQQALANQAALQGARAQMDIQSRVDPQAYAQRQMRMDMANKRLGKIAGVDPTSVNYRSPDAYAIPGTNATPDLATLQSMGQNVASNLSFGSVNSHGDNPQLITPGSKSSPVTPFSAPAYSYLNA